MNIAVIPAAGSGKRMGATLPKQFAEVCGKPLIIHTLQTINSNADIDAIIIGCAYKYKKLLGEICSIWGITKLKKTVTGGETRQETVYACLKAIDANLDDIILIHDAARPLVTDDIISTNLAAAKTHGVVNTVIRITDTVIKSRDGEFTSSVLDRSELYRVQTPQTFQYQIILKAHEHALKNGNTSKTDDCGLCLDMGVPVFLAEGCPSNIKITTKADMDMFKAVMRGGTVSCKTW